MATTPSPVVRLELHIEAVRADGDRGRYPDPVEIPAHCLICLGPVLADDGTTSVASLATVGTKLGMVCNRHPRR